MVSLVELRELIVARAKEVRWTSRSGHTRGESCRVRQRSRVATMQGVTQTERSVSETSWGPKSMRRRLATSGIPFCHYCYEPRFARLAVRSSGHFHRIPHARLHILLIFIVEGKKFSYHMWGKKFGQTGQTDFSPFILLDVVLLGVRS